MQRGRARTSSHTLGIHPALNEPMEEPQNKAAAQESAPCGRTPRSLEHGLEPWHSPAPRLHMPGMLEKLWVLCRNMGVVSTLPGEQEMGRWVDEFLYESHTTAMRSAGQDLENNVNPFPVGNLLVGWCSVSAISSVALNEEVQGNKLRVERK